MKITIVGAGAIGKLWGCHLQAEHDVHFITRDKSDSLDIDFTDIKGKTSHIGFTCNQDKLLAKAELVLICVKAFKLESALKQITDSVPEKTPIVIMHNGMGTHDLVPHYFPANPILYASTSQAAFCQNKHSVTHTGVGPTRIGALDKQDTFSFIADSFNHALSPCHWHQDIFEPLWQKLAINCAINPLTALNQCPNGELSQPQYQDQLNDICQEVASAMSAEGYSVQADHLLDQVNTVIKATANNYSSMHQDIYYQRQTEIDYINGYLIARANAHHIDVPANTALWQQIKTMENNYD